MAAATPPKQHTRWILERMCLKGNIGERTDEQERVRLPFEWQQPECVTEAGEKDREEVEPEDGHLLAKRPRGQG